MKKILTFVQLLSIIIFFFAATTSCTPRIAYFRDIPDSTKKPVFVPVGAYEPPPILVDDIINISVQTLDPTASKIINEGNLPVLAPASSSVNGNLQQTSLSGYLVDAMGFINLPYVGKLHVAGLTTLQARDTITNRLLEFIKAPTVNVRIANFKITILGVVEKSTSFLIPTEKTTIIDALGYAGDVQIYGKHNNVILMRDTIGGKLITRINLDSSKYISSRFFYLRQNDMIYVEPTATAVAKANVFRTIYISLSVAILSTILIVFRHL
jgi:polysaccharide export outer membrane protein